MKIEGLKTRNERPDISTALFLAAVCGQTYVQYTNKEEEGLFLVPQTYRLVGGFTASAYDNRREPFGFVLESDCCIVLAFRGTGSAVEWVSDFIAQQIPYRPVKGAGQTHKGFTDIYMSARDEVMALLSELSPEKTLFITGHSLGGALATLAAMDLSVNTLWSSPVVYTFAAPRVGDPKFAKTYNYVVPTHFRFQNEFDVVPHLPPILYTSPRTKKTYYYLHVKGEVMRAFRMGTVAGNHALPSYFADLEKEEPILAEAICEAPPGWCPLNRKKDHLG